LAPFSNIPLASRAKRVIFAILKAPKERVLKSEAALFGESTILTGKESPKVFWLLPASVLQQ
jgi:hypothetical protein